MKNVYLLFFICLLGLSSFGQSTLREEGKERRRDKMMQLPDNGVRKETVFKLRGYTDSTRLYYSRTAHCKMECIKVLEEDVRLVLKEGAATLGKPRDSTDTQKIFIVEGNTKMNKRIRVVVTPKGNALYVITVNPFGEKAECDCNQKDS